jgi:hypothetical protein
MERLSRSYDLTIIQDYKDYLNMLIDKKTEETIFSGFTFDGGLFSMSLSAQINWSNLFFIPDGMWPITLSYKDDTGTYQLSLANRANFYGSALLHKNTALQTGTILKTSVTNALTLEELDIIKGQL